jgi:hypothetical protein
MTVEISSLHPHHTASIQMTLESAPITRVTGYSSRSGEFARKGKPIDCIFKEGPLHRRGRARLEYHEFKQKQMTRGEILHLL